MCGWTSVFNINAVLAAICAVTAILAWLYVGAGLASTG